MKVRAIDIGKLREDAYRRFRAAHDAAQDANEMARAWVAYTAFLHGFPALGHARGPALPPRVEAAMSTAHYERIENG